MRPAGAFVIVRSMIAVCPITRLRECAERFGAGRLLSLVTEGTEVDRPERIAAADHLTLYFHDISEPLCGYVPPCERHVAEALDFAAADDRPVLIHCYAGVSRSTAAAYAIACAREPERDEFELARTLRALSPTATPNRLIVRLADAALGRRGRMIAAIEAIGRGRDAFEGAPFALVPTPSLVRELVAV
jgi:predicted protein tyrosine phosphatase